MPAKALVDVERIQRAVLRVRTQNVMLDSDLATLYGVEVKALNQAARRNKERFPADFMFQLTWEEARSLRSQTVTLDFSRGRHCKYLPKAFTEQGASCAACSARTRSWPESSTRSSRNTMASLESCFTPSGN